MSKYQQINLDEYTRSGEGGTAVTYTRKDGNSLAKLYNPGFEADNAEKEYLTARAVFEMGVPTPEPYRLVTDGQRHGAEYELIKDKRSFARIISEQPDRLQEISLSFAGMAKKLHQMPADTNRIPDIKDVLRQFYTEKNCVPEEYKQRALHFLEISPEGNTCIHGDLHIGNIITDGKRSLWIDIGQFGFGVPEWDLGWMWTICHNLDEKRADFLLHLTPEALVNHWNIFISAYLGTTNPQEIESFTRRILPFYAVKCPYMFDMVNHSDFPESGCQALVKLIP